MWGKKHRVWQESSISTATTRFKRFIHWLRLRFIKRSSNLLTKTSFFTALDLLWKLCKIHKQLVSGNWNRYQMLLLVFSWKAYYNNLDCIYLTSNHHFLQCSWRTNYIAPVCFIVLTLCNPNCQSKIQHIIITSHRKLELFTQNSFKMCNALKSWKDVCSKKRNWIFSNMCFQKWTSASRHLRPLSRSFN